MHHDCGFAAIFGPQVAEKLAAPRIQALISESLYNILFDLVIRPPFSHGHVDIDGIEQVVVVVIVIVVIAVVVVVADIVGNVHDGVDADQNEGQEGKGREPTVVFDGWAFLFS